MVSEKREGDEADSGADRGACFLGGQGAWGLSQLDFFYLP